MAKQPPDGIQSVLNAARQAAAHTTDLGDRFERLAAAVLTAHPGPAAADKSKKRAADADESQARHPQHGASLIAGQTPTARSLPTSSLFDRAALCDPRMGECYVAVFISRGCRRGAGNRLSRRAVMRRSIPGGGRARMSTGVSLRLKPSSPGRKLWSVSRRLDFGGCRCGAM